MTDRDILRRFLFEEWPVRGHFIRLDASWRAMIEHHQYPPALAQVLGEAMAATIENSRQASPYQGVVPLSHPRLAECLEEYFARSEQLPTRLVLAANHERAAGLLLQRVATGSRASSGQDPHALEEAEDAWRRIGLLAATLTGEELLRQPCEVLLRRLFREEDVRLFEGTPVFFRCACSRQRVSGILRSLGRAEVEDILRERGEVEVRCEFCNRTYSFDAVDCARLFAAPGQQGAAPGLH